MRENEIATSYAAWLAAISDGFLDTMRTPEKPGLGHRSAITVAAERLGRDRNTVTRHVRSALAAEACASAESAGGDASPSAVRLGTFQARPVPYSQSQDKEWSATKDECIEELWRIVKAHPDQVISRNYFRVMSKFSESA
ncbi:MAG: hypothetical protein P4L71_00415 [Acetobacteraceae bacterium]|nr:hypothetical protein [Acetobacteraceae bacterium]